MKSAKSLLFFCLSLCAVGAAVASFYSLQGALISAEAASQSRTIETAWLRLGDTSHSSDSGRIQGALAANLRAAARTGSASDTIRAAAWLSARAQRSVSPEERIALVCQVSSLYHNALERNPRDSRLLIGLASQQQLLAGYRCPDGPLVGAVSDLVDRALYWAPWDRDILIWGARLKLWSGDRDGALTLFGRSLLYSTEPTEGQEGEIIDELQSATEFSRVIPTKFPQIIRLSARLKERRPQEFHLWKSDAAQMQMKATDEARQRYERGELPRSFFERELRELQEVAATDEVRRRVDAELAGLARLRGSEVEAEVLQKRAQLNKLQFVPAVGSSDTRPTTSPLVEWGFERELAFDDFYQSIGFYLPAQQGVALILLRGTIPAEPVSLDAIRVLASEDNERWIEVRPAQIQMFSSGSHEFLAISVELEWHRYWKINNNSPVRRKQFEGSVQDMLLVYGNSARRDDLE